MTSDQRPIDEESFRTVYDYTREELDDRADDEAARYEKQIEQRCER